jgi:hypothetical protein
MRISTRKWLGWAAAGALVAMLPAVADSMCGYFSPRIIDIQQRVLQPSQMAFITWDPAKQIETVSVQPRFEGNARDFGMVIPTPSQPKLDEVPRDLFKALRVFTTPKHRVTPQSQLLPFVPRFGGRGLGAPGAVREANKSGGDAGVDLPRPTTVKVHEVGIVGSLDYKILSAGRPDDLFNWLKDNKYSFAGDEATLDYYVKKKYFFTVMKIDTLQMKRNADGSYTGDVTPVRFSFRSEKLVYPLKITQVSVRDKTEALFYVQAPFKVDLPKDMSYQFQWVSLMQQVLGNMGPGEVPEKTRNWLKAVQEKDPTLLRRSQDLGFQFNLHQPAPQPNQKGIMPSTLEWAKRLTADDIRIISGEAPYSLTVPDPDWGFTRLDLQDQQRAQAIFKVIRARLQKYQQEQPRGYPVREASKEDLASLPFLKGHLREGQFLTKFVRVFTKGEMAEDLELVAAQAGQARDESEHDELLRTVIFGRGRPFLPPPPRLPARPIGAPGAR